jgi:hypothetical protein
MSVQQKRLSKKEKKVLAFRARKGKGKLEAPGVPIVDVIHDEENGNSMQITYQLKKPGDRKPVNKKRKRPDVEEDANAVAKEEMPKQKKQKREVRDADGEQTNMAETKPKKNDLSKYILFVGKYDEFM